MTRRNSDGPARFDGMRPIEKTVPPAGGLRQSRSNATPSLAYCGYYLACPVCGITFRKAVSHVLRDDNSHCSRACANEGRKVRFEKPCVVCARPMSLTPSNMTRITTCSKACSSVRRRQGERPTRNASTTAYRALAKAMLGDPRCARCDGTAGPWVVRGIRVTYPDDIPTADAAAASIWCRQCHLQEIAPSGSRVRDAKKAGRRADGSARATVT